MGLRVREEEFYIYFILSFANFFFFFFTKSMHGLSFFKLALLFFKRQKEDFQIIRECLPE